MKKSVNGKSFDVIFLQRGRRVRIDELKDGRVYLFDQKGRFDWDWIGRVSKEKSIIFVIWFGKQYIASDGDVRTLDGGIDYRDVAAIHEATPDQIDLLNAYK